MIALPLALALVLASDTPPGAGPRAGPARGALSSSARRAAARSARPEPVTEPPEDPGKLLLESKCGKCHDVDRATGSTLSESGWKLHMKRMGKLPGAAITDDQAAQIHDYLRKSASAPRP